MVSISLLSPLAECFEHLLADRSVVSASTLLVLGRTGGKDLAVIRGDRVNSLAVRLREFS